MKKIVYRSAESSDLLGILDLWEEAFGDSKESVSFFFRYFPQCRSYVAEEAGKVCSMVHVLPQLLSPDTPAAYIYAVATAKDQRGRGLCRNLMSFSEKALRRSGFACCMLTPGEPTLFSFYQNLGYEAVFTRKRSTFPGGVPISSGDYVRLREQILTVPHVCYDRHTLEYAAKIYDLSFYRTDTGVAAAGKAYTAEVLPEDIGGAPFAMVKWLDDKPPLQDAYLGFSLE